MGKRAIQDCLEVANILLCIEDKEGDDKETAYRIAFGHWQHVHAVICDELRNLKKEKSGQGQSLT